MNFKDLQFNIGKLTTNVKSQVARNNPLQNHDTRSLNLWLFEERNDLSFMRTTAYHHAETNKAFLEWIKDELEKNKQHENYSEDIEDVGSTLALLLDKQVELEKQYTERYKLYRRAIKSMREKEVELADLREKKQSIQERINHLSKSNSNSKKIPELQKELDQLQTSSKEAEAHEYKRFIMKEAFYLRFNALQEYAEKTAIVAGYGKYIVDLLDAQNHASSNCDMILKDALLTVDAWKPKDERVTLTEEEILFQHEDEDEEDALLLTTHDMQIKKKDHQQQQQAPTAISTPFERGTEASKPPAVTTTTKNTSCDKSTDIKHEFDPNTKATASNSKTTDYYHRLYQDKKSKQKHQCIQHHRSYADFQNQFDIPPPSHINGSGLDPEKQEYFAEAPPPAYSNTNNIPSIHPDKKQ
ncbi:lipid-binding protein [Mucor circinelloides]